MKKWVRLYRDDDETEAVAEGFIVKEGSGILGDTANAAQACAFFLGIEIYGTSEADWMTVQTHTGRLHTFVMRLKEGAEMVDYLISTSPATIPMSWMARYINSTRGLHRDTEYIKAMQEMIDPACWNGWSGNIEQPYVLYKPSDLPSPQDVWFPILTVGDFFGFNGVFAEFDIRVFLVQEGGLATLYYSFKSENSRDWVQTGDNSFKKIPGFVSRNIVVDTDLLAACYDAFLHVLRERNEKLRIAAVV